MNSVDGPGERHDAAIALLVRWRERAWWWRVGFGLPAFLGAVALSVGERQAVWFGFGGGRVWADPILVGLLASFVGALAAELHHLRGRTGDHRVVTLQPRDLEAYRPWLTSNPRRLLPDVTDAVAVAVAADAR